MIYIRSGDRLAILLFSSSSSPRTLVFHGHYTVRDFTECFNAICAIRGIREFSVADGTRFFTSLRFLFGAIFA